MFRTRDFGLRTLYVRLDDEILDGSFAVATENARGFEFWLTDVQGELADTTGAEVTLSMLKNGKLYQTAAEVKDATKGHYIVTFAPDALATAGTMEIQFIVAKDGEVLKSTPQKMKVYPALDGTTPGGGNVLIDFEKLNEAVELSRTIVTEAGTIKKDTAAIAEEVRKTKTEVDDKAREVTKNATEVREIKETFRDIADSESARKEAETARASAEEERVQSETTRSTAEEAREKAEAERKTSETTRRDAELARGSAEETRKDAEAKRTNAETDRAAKESARVEAEGARAQAETTRSNDEATRQAAEEARKAAEEIRVNQEQTRDQAEETRTSAEQARRSAEEERKDAETARKQAESDRFREENARAGAETARVRAENTRATEEEIRASAEATRVEQQAQNHQTATEDHSKIMAALDLIKKLETGEIIAEVAGIKTTSEENKKAIATLLEGVTDKDLDQIAEIAAAIRKGGKDLEAIVAQLAEKAEKKDLELKEKALRELIGTKANASDVARDLAGKVDTSVYDVAIAGKADKTKVDTLEAQAKRHFTEASIADEKLNLTRENGTAVALTLPKGFSGAYGDLSGVPNFVHASGGKITMAAEQGTVAITIEEV